MAVVDGGMLQLAAAGRGGQAGMVPGQTWDGCLQVATAADVGVGDAAELGGELFPGTGEDEVSIVRPGGCVLAGERGEGHSGLHYLSRVAGYLKHSNLSITYFRSNSALNLKACNHS